SHAARYARPHRVRVEPPARHHDSRRDGRRPRPCAARRQDDRPGHDRVGMGHRPSPGGQPGVRSVGQPVRDLQLVARAGVAHLHLPRHAGGDARAVRLGHRQRDVDGHRTRCEALRFEPVRGRGLPRGAGWHTGTGRDGPRRRVRHRVRPGRLDAGRRPIGDDLPRARRPRHRVRDPSRERRRVSSRDEPGGRPPRHRADARHLRSHLQDRPARDGHDDRLVARAAAGVGLRSRPRAVRDRRARRFERSPPARGRRLVHTGRRRRDARRRRLRSQRRAGRRLERNRLPLRITAKTRRARRLCFSFVNFATFVVEFLRMSHLFARKPIADLQPGPEGAQSLKRVLGAGDLIGAGIFGAIGTAAAGQTGPGGEVVRYGAGPALVFSFVLLGAACALAALCYAELAAMIPQAGSAYAYSYATLGELVAWIIGWDLILEYAVGNVAVAISWGDYFTTLLRGIGITLPVFLTTGYRTALLSSNPDVHGLLDAAPHLAGMPILINVPAFGIVMLITWLLLRGAKESVRANNIMVVVKL